VTTAHSPDLAEALGALGAKELRSLIQETLGGLDDGPRGHIEDALLRRAASAGSGWRPVAPPRKIVDEVKGFVAAALRVAQADPSDVDDYLRQGVTASLASDHEGARALFEALLPPIAHADIYLGQDEMVDEVLSVDVNDCVARYLAAVYLTTPPGERAERFLEAIEKTNGLAYFLDPLQAMEGVLGKTPSDLEGFLSPWIARLEREKRAVGDWESEQDRWLREAIRRRDGVAGLERIARTTKTPEAVRAWCDAVVVAGDWGRALAVYEEASELVPSTVWRGDFLDGAALAAQVLERKDATEKLGIAWLRAPSLARLLRWLLAGTPSPATLKKRATTALEVCPTKSPRILGLLHVLLGDVPAAATLLKKAPGLGWSSSDHPGHLLFPVLAWIGGTPAGSVRERVAQVLRSPARELGDFDDAGADDAGTTKAATPRLSRPSVMDALGRAELAKKLTAMDRASALAAMKTAATKRTDGVLDNKRRRHYAHAALLVACCVELEHGSGSAAGKSAWAESIRAETQRFPAFQRELRSALEQAQR
jgi:hypothetical protein